MKSNSPLLAASVPSATLLVSFYVLEFSTLLAGMAIYKKGDTPLLVFLPTHAGFVLSFAASAVASSIVVIICLVSKHALAGSKQFVLTLSLNLLTMIIILAVVELIVRVFATNTPGGKVFANTLLLPRSWESIVTPNREFFAKPSNRWAPYFDYDSILGWTVGRSRRSQDGMYFSSAEGIRSPNVGITFTGIPVKHRIAIVGDSFTFGLDVYYQETWGHQLEIALGPGTQVLNFGVDGYGVDQAHLRYQRDVIPWHPEIVILGIINDDLRRTMGVYRFMTFPHGEVPFPKPRFVVRAKALVPLNLPLPTLETIVFSKSITDLPFIRYDAAFHRHEWESYLDRFPYSIRFLLSRFPRWPMPDPATSDEALEHINGEIFASFVRLARESGSIPIVVYFPSRSDFVASSKPGTGPRIVAKEVLQANGIPYHDMTSCISNLNPSKRFGKAHYSAVANAAIAKCLEDVIRVALYRK